MLEFRISTFVSQSSSLTVFPITFVKCFLTSRLCNTQFYLLVGEYSKNKSVLSFWTILLIRRLFPTFLSPITIIFSIWWDISRFWVISDCIEFTLVEQSLLLWVLYIEWLIFLRIRSSYSLFSIASKERDLLNLLSLKIEAQFPSLFFSL